MQLILLDDSIKASTRLNLLQEYPIEHCQTVRELVGMTPELIIVDEAHSPETIAELQKWGLSVCIIAERITIPLRRKYPMVQDMVTENTVLAFLNERIQQDETTGQVAETEVVATVESEVPSVPAPISKPVMPVTTRPSTGRGASVLGVASLRNYGSGSGKTGVLFNYAAYASAKEMRKVLVVDLDPKGLFGYLAGSKHELTTEHWSNLMGQNPEGLTERAVFDNIERQEKYGFYMITAASREDMISKEQFRWILEQTRPYFDIIFFDMPSSWTTTTLELMQRSDYLYVFGVHDQIQYAEFKRGIQQITHPLIGGTNTSRMTVVLGRAYLGKNLDIELEEVKRQLGVENVFLIPEDPLFQKYRNQHQAIVLEKPSATSAKAMIPWLKGQMETTVAQPNLPALYTPKQSLFARMFGSGKRKAASNGKGV